MINTRKVDMGSEGFLDQNHWNDRAKEKPCSTGPDFLRLLFCYRC